MTPAPAPASRSLSLTWSRSARLSQQKLGRGGREPWHAGDVSSLATLNAVGLALLVTGWFMASGQLLFHNQVAGANVAVAGVIVAGVGNGVWLVTGRRAVGMRREVFARSVVAYATDRANTPSATAALPVAATGMTKYHRPECPFVAERRVTSRTAKTHEKQGRTPCGVCRP